MPFEMDGWGVDVAVTGSQKGLMTLPGLGFVAAGPKAMAAHKTADLRTRYWDWTERGGAEHYQKYYGTPPDICRSACARRWTSSSPRGWRRGSAATGCWPSRCAPRLQADARAAHSPSTSPPPRSGRIRSETRRCGKGGGRTGGY